MNDWLLSCRKTFRLFLRRIYFSKKAHRERELSRPLTTSESKPEGHRRSYIINLTLLAITLAVYLFILPSSTPAPPLTYSEKSIEKPVVFDPKQVMKIHIPKEAKIKLAENWIARHAPEKNIGIIVHTASSAKIERETKSYLQLALEAPSSVIDIDTSKTSSTTTPSPRFEIPTCVTRAWADKLVLNTSLSKVSLDNLYPMVRKGGHFIPTHCITKHKVAIIVPYRNRTRNLRTFLFNIHPFLMSQDIEYRIFVIEQFGDKKFNKGRLFNAGFKEMLKFGYWRCVVFHDVDLLPMDRRIFYTCPQSPRHMSSSVIDKGSRRNTKSPILFGGVTSMPVEHYVKANGHSNLYWGWGGEDYDMFWRIRAALIPIVRYNRTIAKFFALPHARAPENPIRYSLLRTAIERWQDEGLNSIDYKVISVTLRHLFTHILVEIQPGGDTSNMKGIVKTIPSTSAVKQRWRTIPSLSIINQPL